MNLKIILNYYLVIQKYYMILVLAINAISDTANINLKTWFTQYKL